MYHWNTGITRSTVKVNICKSASWTIWEGKFQAARGPGCDWVRKQKGQGAKASGSESFRERIGQGPGSELARERKGCESCLHVHYCVGRLHQHAAERRWGRGLPDICSLLPPMGRCADVADALIIRTDKTRRAAMCDFL